MSWFHKTYVVLLIPKFNNNNMYPLASSHVKPYRRRLYGTNGFVLQVLATCLSNYAVIYML